jgi:glyoxylase-like metal-dependent hydrolase (beta-lactamase superfamily II)
MIDTGFPCKLEVIEQELNSYHIEKENIKHILLTHGDVDHIGNLKKLIKATHCDVFAHPDELPYLAKKKRYSIRK